MTLRFQLGLLGLGLFLAVWGGHKTIVGFGNSSPTRLTYKEYSQGQTDAKWLVLDECFINYAHGVAIETYEEDSGRTVDTDYFVPIYTSGDDSMYVKAFLAVEDSSGIGLIEESWDKDENWVYENRARLIDDPVQIKGLARSGLDLSSEDEEILRSLADEVDPDFTIIDPDKEPQGFLGFAGLLAGLGLIGGGGFWLFTGARSSRKKRADAYPSHGHSGAPRPPGPPHPGSEHQPGVASSPHDSGAPTPPYGPGAPPQSGPGGHLQRGPDAPPRPQHGPVAPPPAQGHVDASPQQRPPGDPLRPSGEGSGHHPKQGPKMPRPRRRPPM